MANINQFIPFVLKWEGGYVNDPNDFFLAKATGEDSETVNKLD